MKSWPKPEWAWTLAWCALALAFPWSNSGMSIATGALALAAIYSFIQGPTSESSGFRDKRVGFAGFALLSFVSLSGFSSAWSDPMLALNDVRVKLPLAVAGMALLAAKNGSYLSRLSVERVLKCAVFSAGLSTACIVCLDLWDGQPFGGRSASRFISHIRFGLWWAALLPLASGVLNKYWGWSSVFFAVLAWTWTESISGLALEAVTSIWWLPILCATSSGNSAWKWPEMKALRRAAFIATGLGALLFSFLWWSLPNDHPHPNQVLESSQGGEPYFHNLDRRVTENGHFIWTNIAWGELAKGWSTRSETPFKEVQGRLIRFLSSKGLNKDKEGVAALTPDEIQAIVSGYPSVIEWKGLGWSRRWNRICFNWGRWLDGSTPFDDSILSRMSYHEVARVAISEMSFAGWAFGVGSGDKDTAMMAVYEGHFDHWPAGSRERAHHQYLSVLLGLGILGLLLWLMGHAVALTTRQAWPGLLVLVLSCWTEDTLETQAGVTLALWVLAFPVFASRGWLRKGPSSPQ